MYSQPQQPPQKHSHKRFNDLLDALKEEYEVALGNATAAAMAAVSQQPDPAHMAEVLLIQKSVKEMEAMFVAMKSGYEAEIERLKSALQSANLPLPPPTAGAASSPRDSQQPPSLEGELTSGVLTNAFSGDKRPPSLAGHDGDHKKAKLAPSTSPKAASPYDWLTVYSQKVAKALSIDLAQTVTQDSVVCSVRFSHDGRLVACGGNRAVAVFEVLTGRRVCTLSDTVERDGDLYMRSVCFSPDDRLVAAGSEDHFVRVWTLASGRIKHRLAGHYQDVYAVDFLPDGRGLVSASGDRSIKIWDVGTGECRATLTATVELPKDAGITSLAISSSGSLVVSVPSLFVD